MHKPLILALMIGAPGGAYAQSSGAPLATDTQVSPVSAPATMAPAPAAKADKLRCKSTNSVGSRTRKARICLTEAEWRRESELARSDTRALQDRSVPPRDR